MEGKKKENRPDRARLDLIPSIMWLQRNFKFKKLALTLGKQEFTVATKYLRVQMVSSI